MARQTYYPKAGRSQDFSSRYTGSLMNPNVVVLHSTETVGWPGYQSGATAPHFTILPDFATKTVKIRQHFPVNRSARALVNAAGGVETNTLNAVQIEMIGTCDPATHRRWGSTPHIYMPEAPDWYLKGVADLLAWLEREWEDFPLRDAAPRGWLAYPGSYANGKGQRLTHAEWRNAYGIVGHQHVPENHHGDPGAFPIARLIELAKGSAPAVPTPAPTPTPEPRSEDWLKVTLVNHAAASAAMRTLAAKAKWLRRRKRLVLNTVAVGADVVGALECGAGAQWHYISTKYRKRGLTLVPGGKGGRHIFVDPKRVKVKDFGAFDPPRLGNDDKPAPWVVAEIDGTLGMVVLFHLEPSSGADNLRVEQAAHIIREAEKEAKAHGIGRSRIIFMGDSASDDWVRQRAFGAAGYRDAFDVARRSVGKSIKSYNQWRPARPGARVDLIAVYYGKGPGKGDDHARPVRVVSQRLDHVAADHHLQSAVIERMAPED